MSLLSSTLILLAEKSRFQHMGRRFEPGGASFEFGDVLIGMVVIGAIIALLWGLQQLVERKNRPSYHSPRALFGELCRAHGIAWAGRRLLRRLARTQQLAQPSQLFLDPEQFDPDALAPALATHRTQLESLRDKIFGVELEEDDSASV